MTSSRNSSPLSLFSRRSATFFLVVLLHAGMIFGPLVMFDLFERRKPKEDMFRVKIGGKELSQGPMVGMPERLPPRPPAPPEPAIPQTPPQKIPAEPKVPKLPPRKKTPRKKTPRKKTPRKKTPPKKKRVVTPEKRVKPRPERKVTPKKRVKPRPGRKVTPKKKTPPKKARRNPLEDVYKDPSPNWNPRVPIGSANRAQKYAAKADNKAPGGGRKADEAALIRYGKNVERYIYSRWTEPPRSLLGGTFPETVIEVTIEPNGKVTSAKVVRSSGSRPMEQSVQTLLNGLDLLPRPPDGRITFRITLRTR